MGAAQAFVLRDRTVAARSTWPRPWARLVPTSEPRRHANVVIVSAAGQIGGIEVDRLGERLDVMLKPMEGLLGGMRGVAGTTLLGDGRVLVVLDVQEMLR
jgi:two-component system chemotaxis sensor kinase CheA